MVLPVFILGAVAPCTRCPSAPNRKIRSTKGSPCRRSKIPVNEKIEEKALIKRSLDGNIGTITLDNPSKHNALGAALIGELLLALSDLTNAGARAIILRAYKGAKVWSAGHDIRELPTNGRDPLTYDDPLRRVVRVIKESPTPIIAMVDGGVWVGACEAACDDEGRY